MTRHDPSLIKQALFQSAVRLQKLSGWNQLDRLLFLKMNNNELEVGFLPNQPLPHGVDASHFLITMAEVAREKPAALRHFERAVTDLYGIGLIVEGEMTPGLTPDQWGDRRRPEDWEGDPSLRYCRLITAIDLYGQVFNVKHTPGRAPMVVQHGDLQDDEIVGTPVEGLRQLFIEFLKLAPASKETAEAIERLQELIVPSIEETLAVVRLRESREGPA